MRFLIATFAFMLFPGASIAQSFNGNSYYETCRGTASTQLLCIGYTKGVLDGVRGYLIFRDFATRGPYDSKQESEAATVRINQQVPFCTPAGGTIEQFTDIVVNRLEKSPEVRHLPASLLIIDTLSRTFPCK